MKIVNVALNSSPYKIIIGENTFKEISGQLKRLSLSPNAIIITNPIVGKLYQRTLVSALNKNNITAKVIQVPDGEKSKSLKYVQILLETIAEYDQLKNVFIIALGGGVIGDLAGFVAAIYKRGVDFVQVPTTLLAQIDSAIGGKVGVDLNIGKNLVGAFYQPKIVYSDVALLSSLNIRQIRNGLAEAIKYGIIYDSKFFKFIEQNYSLLLKKDLGTLLKVVHRCSQIKAEVVLADEKETKSIRTILNFGHTLGHAIEAAGKYKLYHHGEAIALGMRMAADLSLKKKLINSSQVQQINSLISNVGLPEKVKNIKVPQILKIMQYDKKFISGKNRFVLAEKIGKVRVVEALPIKMIEASIRKFMV
ncbi:MAG: 3-dehydroquinate synthase [Candidatus Omnitrophica bacterium]|nr:3-dehydroquinate synthase [Candidatus Omnitrophota bacterium]MCB9747709.1 3-dehydroquinate synthase [Candidatus Omnitrophota bacterium]